MGDFVVGAVAVVFAYGLVFFAGFVSGVFVERRAKGVERG